MVARLRREHTMADYRTAPQATDKMPGGIPYIIGNEAAERFSYYGMKAILVVFMTQYLMTSGGNYDVMGEAEAKSWYHFFNSAVYFFPIFGAIIADAFFGKYKTILSLSIVYCLGHLVLAIFETRFGLSLGLTLIAIGSGGIKPCVSAHVGDQFGKSNKHLLEKVFQWFYFSINFGSFLSTLLTPWLLANYGPGLAFGIPGLLMGVATFVFWLGRHKFIHIQPQGKEFVKETFSGAGLKAMGQLIVVYIFIAMFWALFDQTGSAWVLQAQKMDLHFMGIEWLPSQIQAINPILVMIFIPLTAWVIYPAINKVFPLTPLRKIGIGFFITVPAFLLPAWIETQLAEGIQVNIGWQLVSYIIITLAEVFVSITALEFSYTQAPKKMKSLVMGLFLMSVMLGNIFTAAVNVFIQEEAQVAEIVAVDGRVTGSQEVSLDKTTSFGFACTAGDTSLQRSERVEVAVPIVPVDHGPKPESVEITAFTGAAASAPKVVRSGTLPVAPGEAVTLAWSAKGADACTMSFFDDQTFGASGTVEVKLDTPRTYVLKCTGANLEPAEKRMEINATTGMALISYGVDKSALSPPGGKVTLTYDVLKAEKCTITANTVTLSATGYYIFFATCMAIAAVLFIFVAMWFKPKTYIQDEEDQE